MWSTTAANRNERVEARLEVDRAGVRTPLESLPFPPAQRTPIEEFLGDYASTTLPAGITLESRGGLLALHQEQSLLALPPFMDIGEDAFLCDAGAALRFTRDADGAIDGLVMDVNRARGLEFTAFE